MDKLRLDVMFFFQAEDGIRDLTVTGVQTCALPISHAQADAARAERIARGFEGPLGELRGGGEFDARLELLERRQGERHRRTEQEGRNQGAQDACRRDHAVRTWCAGAPRTAPSRTRDATCRAAR